MAASVPAIHYEFPCGYHQEFGHERYKLAEGLFDHAMLGAGYIGNYHFVHLKASPFPYLLL